MALRHLLPVLASMLAIVPGFARTAAAAEPVISGPVLHENVALFFVHGTSAPGPVPATLAEALAKGTVEVHEIGDVQELKIENKGAEPVFVQIGDIVKGGKQDRVLTVSLLLEPHSKPVPVGAFCVEQGRWAARGKEDVTRFAASEALMPSREAKVALARKAAPQAPDAAPAPTGEQAVSGPLAQGNATERLEPRRRTEQRQLRTSPRGDGQGEVWRSVDVMQRMLSASLSAPVAAEESRTSLQLSLENQKLKAAQATAVEKLLPAGLAKDDILGVVVAVDGRLSGADVYPSNGLFRKMWPKLAQAAAVEALAARSGTGPKSEVPTAEAARAFLAEVEASGTRERRQEVAGTVVLGRESEKALRVEARTSAGVSVHRNYVAK